MLNVKHLPMLLVFLAVAFSNVQCKKPAIRLLNINFNVVQTKINVPLARSQNVFLANITIGTPAQNFSVALDPEKTDFWVLASSCTTGLCSLRRKFDGAKSSTFKNSDTKRLVVYRDLSTVEGRLVTDVVTLGSIRVRNQNFIHANNLTGFTNEPYDGLLGVAYTPVGSNRTFTTPLENWAKNNPAANKNIFSFMVSGKSGTLVLGGVDTKIKASKSILVVKVYLKLLKSFFL